MLFGLDRRNDGGGSRPLQPVAFAVVRVEERVDGLCDLAACGPLVADPQFAPRPGVADAPHEATEDPVEDTGVHHGPQTRDVAEKASNQVCPARPRPVDEKILCGLRTAPLEGLDRGPHVVGVGGESVKVDPVTALARHA